ncbi:MAG: hypothetical protein HC783_15420 [Rhodobacteraceae bacterium]|nr:hypothetical protein [Paracoccaceae bacterium]
MLRPLLLTLLALPAAGPSAAEDAAWPAEFAAIIASSSTLCEGFSVSPEAVSQRDLNGDGTLDWVLDTGGFACANSYGTFCGTGGCAVETLIAGVPGSLLLHSWEIETVSTTTTLTAPNRSGETVRFLWTGSEWQLQ